MTFIILTKYQYNNEQKFYLKIIYELPSENCEARLLNRTTFTRIQINRLITQRQYTLLNHHAYGFDNIPALDQYSRRL